MVKIQNKMIPFPCTKCGLCCQFVGLSEQTKFLDRGDGVCKHYETTQNICLIYNDRPDICRVDRQYKLNYQQLYSWEDFIKLNLDACKQLETLKKKDDFINTP